MKTANHIHYDGAEFFKFGIFFLAWAVIFFVISIVLHNNLIGQFIGLIR